ncbi:MAG: GNAT family N-acetyltransferase [Sphaerochaetaceae bacterium]
MMNVHVIRPREESPLLARCIELRRKIFIEEQNVAYEIEQDGLDRDSYHLLVEDESGFIATMRAQPKENKIKFGRIAVVRQRRSQGIGSYIVKEALKLFPETMIYLHAQEHAVGFYRSLGFLPTEERTVEAGIAHITMIYTT